MTEFGGDKQDLAKAVGVNRSTFSRLLSGKTKPSPELCLRLAHVTSKNPLQILNAAGYKHIAHLLEKLCPPPVERHRHTLTPVDAKTMRALRHLRSKEGHALLLILVLLTGSAKDVKTVRRQTLRRSASGS